MSDDEEQAQRWLTEFKLHSPPDWKCPKCGSENAYFFTRCAAYLPGGDGCYEPKPEPPRPAA